VVQASGKVEIFELLILKLLPVAGLQPPQDKVISGYLLLVKIVVAV
jgi:hypothetical protein